MKKVKCHKCGQYHDWDAVEVVFKYPKKYFDISEDERSHRVKTNDEICIIDGSAYYLRGLLPFVTTVDHKKKYCWGVWIRVNEETYKVIYDNWDLEDQSHLTGLKGYLANEIAFYKDTLDKDVKIVLTGNETRPEFYFTMDKRLMKIQSNKLDESDLIDIYHYHFKN